MKVNYAFVATAILLACGAAFLLHSTYRENYPLDRVARSEYPVRELIRDVPQLLAEVGAPDTVAIVDRALAQKIIGVDDCHLVLHLIGHESFRIYGTDFDAIAAANKQGTCLDGYLHGVEAEIAASGDLEVQKRFCAYEKQHNLLKSPCYHGVGHSAFELGKNVKEALAVCNSLKDGPEPDLGDCYRGVFSEIGNQLSGYDTNTGMPIKPLNDPTQQLIAERPFAVCLTVGNSYRNDCYSQLSKLYFVPADRDSVFGIAACRSSSKNTTAISLCTKTVSALAVRRMLDTGTTSDIVAFIERVQGTQQRDALQGARSAYFGNDVDRESWKGMCDSFTSEVLKEQCFAL